MLRRSHCRLTVLAAAFGLLVCSLALSAQDDTAKRGRKYKVPPPTGIITVTVVRASNAKPIENAAVVFHPMEGEKDKGAMELKTNEDGKTIIDVLPIGDTVRLQIIARGFQTFGQDYKIDKAAMTIEIKMKRPAPEYSIYKKNDAKADAGKGSDADKPAASAPAATPAPPAADQTPDDSTKQPETQPNPPQSK